MTLTPEQRELVRQARDLAARTRLNTEGLDTLGRRKPGSTGPRFDGRNAKGERFTKGDAGAP